MRGAASGSRRERLAARLAAATAVAVACVVLLSCGPIAIFPGGRLRGELVTEPVADWSFSDAHMTIAVEVRPSFPHSVTTICFTHEGQLYVPASRGSSKKWTHYVLDNPNVRLKIGSKVYLGRASRVLDDSRSDAMRASAAAKYDAFDANQEIPDLWLFRIDPRS